MLPGPHEQGAAKSLQSTFLSRDLILVSQKPWAGRQSILTGWMWDPPEMLGGTLRVDAAMLTV